MDLGAFESTLLKAFDEGSGALWHIGEDDPEEALARRMAAIENQVASGDAGCQGSAALPGDDYRGVGIARSTSSIPILSAVSLDRSSR